MSSRKTGTKAFNSRSKISRTSLTRR